MSAVCDGLERLWLKSHKVLLTSTYNTFTIKEKNMRKTIHENNALPILVIMLRLVLPNWNAIYTSTCIESLVDKGIHFQNKSDMPVVTNWRTYLMKNSRHKKYSHLARIRRITSSPHWFIDVSENERKMRGKFTTSITQLKTALLIFGIIKPNLTEKQDV